MRNPSFVALLRGVNVGKAKRVPMADWRAQLEGLGYTEVATLLNSGNAVFRARSGATRVHAQAISSAIERDLKLSVPVVVKSSTELAAIVAENPYAAVPNELLESGDTVVALGEYSGTYNATGKSFKAPFAHVWRFGGTSITSFVQYTDTAVVQRALQ